MAFSNHFSYDLSQPEEDPDAWRIRGMKQFIHIKPWLAFGSVKTATHFPSLKKLQVTHIINLASGLQNQFPQDVAYLKINIEDLLNQNLKKYFHSIIDFIEEAMRVGGFVFVHCNAALSRSAAVCVAYLMWKDHVSMFTALTFVNDKKGAQIFLDDSLMEQLFQFETSLGTRGSEAEVDCLDIDSEQTITFERAARFRSRDRSPDTYKTLVSPHR